MKDWWQNLAIREKQALIIGGAFLSLFLIYEIIWSPFTSHLDTMRSRIHHNQELLAWMKTADTRIEALEKNSKNSTMHSEGSLLGIMQTHINASPFAKNIKQLRQSDADTVQITLQKIDFDKLITWLTELGQKQGIIVDQINATPGDAPGVAMVEFTVRKSG